MYNAELNNLLALMTETDYRRLQEIFSRYGQTTVDVENENQSVDWFAPINATQHMLMHRQETIRMNSRFYSPQKFRDFAEDMIRVDEINEEEYLRRKNPALRQAWEEYQLILRLIR